MLGMRIENEEIVMAITQKRTTLALTKEDLKQLNSLKNLLGENQNQIFRRALALLYTTKVTKK